MHLIKEKTCLQYKIKPSNYSKKSTRPCSVFAEVQRQA